MMNVGISLALDQKMFAHTGHQCQQGNTETTVNKTNNVTTRQVEDLRGIRILGRNRITMEINTQYANKQYVNKQYGNNTHYNNLISEQQQLQNSPQIKQQPQYMPLSVHHEPRPT